MSWGKVLAVAKNSSGVGVHVAVALALKTVTFARLTPSARTRPVRERSVVSKFELEDLPEQFLRQVEQREMMPVARRILGDSHDITLGMRREYAHTLYRDDGATLADLQRPWRK